MKHCSQLVPLVVILRNRYEVNIPNWGSEQQLKRIHEEGQSGLGAMNVAGANNYLRLRSGVVLVPSRGFVIVATLIGGESPSSSTNRTIYFFLQMLASNRYEPGVVTIWFPLRQNARWHENVIL
jgi:hypothetical protein